MPFGVINDIRCDACSGKLQIPFGRECSDERSDISDRAMACMGGEGDDDSLSPGVCTIVAGECCRVICDDQHWDATGVVGICRDFARLHGRPIELPRAMDAQRPAAAEVFAGCGCRADGSLRLRG